MAKSKPRAYRRVDRAGGAATAPVPKRTGTGNDYAATAPAPTPGRKLLRISTK